MLVLTRRIGETIVIDGGIEVTVVAVQGDKVRIGVTAPPSVSVDREEVRRRRTAFAGPEAVVKGLTHGRRTGRKLERAV